MYRTRITTTPCSLLGKLFRIEYRSKYIPILKGIVADLSRPYSRHHALDSRSSYLAYTPFNKLWRQLKLRLLATRPTPPAHHPSHGIRISPVLRKSAEEDKDTTPIGVDSSTMEYAIERKIIEAPLLEVSYYADVVGDVPPLPHFAEHLGADSVDIGNGDIAPEWGIDIIVSRGFVRYGPWADRQRAELQKAFFPSVYRNLLPTERLEPGDKRLWTAFRIFVELRVDTALHIPFREASKVFIHSS